MLTQCPACAESIQAEARKCPQQMNALGGVDIVFGLASAGIASVGMQGRAMPRAAILGALGLTLVALAVFLFLKHSWAALASLVFYSLFAIGSIAQVNVLGIILSVACIAQSIRVFQFDRELRARGIDPTA